MFGKITRRVFIKQGFFLAGGMLGGMGLARVTSSAIEKPDIFVVHGTNYYANTIKAINGIGGISQIVSRGSKVALLVNHAFMNIGAHVHPDMTVAIARMCFDAGAKDVILIKPPNWGYFLRARFNNQAKDVIRMLKSSSGDYKTVPIRGALALKQADIIRDVLESDVFINTAIAKNHFATYITAVLKNMMGSAHSSTNHKFHQGDRIHLAQCIADINLVRKPDLCVMDATKVLATGGPHGPGLIKNPLKVVASLDPVAVDTYATQLFGLNPKNIKMLDYAFQHGLGQKDLSKIRITEIIS